MNNRMWKKLMDDVFRILSRFAFAGLLAAMLATPVNAGDREQVGEDQDRQGGTDDLTAFEYGREQGNRQQPTSRYAGFRHADDERADRADEERAGGEHVRDCTGVALRIR